MTAIRVVFITTPTSSVARRIAHKILESRLAACVNIVPAVNSHYWWKGKIESARESLLIVKTQRKQVPALIRFVKKIHPYSVPEIIALPVDAGFKPYLHWVSAETR